MHKFKRLIDSHSTNFELVTFTDGNHDDEGEWVNGTEEVIEVTGAIISVKNSVVFNSGGKITHSDRKLYVTFEIPDGAKVRYKNKEYAVTSDRELIGEYADFNSYILKYVSAFDGMKNV